MRICLRCPTPISRRFAVLCARCCKNVTHDFKRAQEIGATSERMTKLDVRERWTADED